MRKLTEIDKKNINRLYELGKMDTEIGKELGINDTTIWYYRKKNNMPTKFSYSKISKINIEKFEELFNKGLSDYAIAKELKMSPSSIHSHRMRYKKFRNDLRPNKVIVLTDFQKQVLLGTLLGDSSLRKDSLNPRVSCAHGIKQKDYCRYKTEIFKSLNAKCYYHKRNIPDKRNGIYYEDYTMYIPANPIFKSWYSCLYLQNKKRIPFELFDYFTEVSLAFMYMDDGNKTKFGYCIATNCFTKEELSEFILFLKNKFNLNISIHANNSIYIKNSSKDLFTSLIKPYVINSMLYKLHN